MVSGERVTLLLQQHQRVGTDIDRNHQLERRDSLLLQRRNSMVYLYATTRAHDPSSQDWKLKERLTVTGLVDRVKNFSL